DDIKYLDKFLVTVRGKGLTKEERRWLLLFKDGCYSVADHVQLVPLIVNNLHNCFTVSQLGKFARYLPFFIERGLVKEGGIAGRQVYYLAKNLLLDKWFHEICAQFEDEDGDLSITKFTWSESVPLTTEASKVILNTARNSGHLSLEQVYLVKDGHGWQLTASKPDPETFTTWFTIRLLSTVRPDGRRVLKADIPPVVTGKTGIDPRKSVFALDSNDQVVLARKAVNESPVTGLKEVSNGFRVTVPETFRDHFFETPVYLVPEDDTSFILSRKKPEMGKVQEVSFRNNQIFIPPALKKSRELRGKECLFILKGTKGKEEWRAIPKGGKVTFPEDVHERAGIPKGRVYLQLHVDDSFTISHKPPITFHEVDLSGITVPGVQRFTVPFDFPLKGVKDGGKCLFTAHGDKQFKVQVFDENVHLEEEQVTEKLVLNKQKTGNLSENEKRENQVTREQMINRKDDQETNLIVSSTTEITPIPVVSIIPLDEFSQNSKVFSVTARISNDGIITIPKDIRDKLIISVGTTVHFWIEKKLLQFSVKLPKHVQNSLSRTVISDYRFTIPKKYRESTKLTQGKECVFTLPISVYNKLLIRNKGASEDFTRILRNIYYRLTKNSDFARGPYTYEWRSHLSLLDEIENSIGSLKDLIEELEFIANLNQTTINSWIKKIGLSPDKTKNIRYSKRVMEFLSGITVSVTNEYDHFKTIEFVFNETNSVTGYEKVSLWADKSLSKIYFLYYHSFKSNYDFLTVFMHTLFDNPEIHYILKYLNNFTITEKIANACGISFAIKNPISDLAKMFVDVQKAILSELKNENTPLLRFLDGLEVDTSGIGKVANILSYGMQLGTLTYILGKPLVDFSDLSRKLLVSAWVDEWNIHAADAYLDARTYHGNSIHKQFSTILGTMVTEAGLSEFDFKNILGFIDPQIVRKRMNLFDERLHIIYNNRDTCYRYLNMLFRYFNDSGEIGLARKFFDLLCIALDKTHPMKAALNQLKKTNYYGYQNTVSVTEIRKCFEIISKSIQNGNVATLYSPSKNLAATRLVIDKAQVNLPDEPFFSSSWFMGDNQAGVETLFKPLIVAKDDFNVITDGTYGKIATHNAQAYSLINRRKEEVTRTISLKVGLYNSLMITTELDVSQKKIIRSLGLKPEDFESKLDDRYKEPLFVKLFWQEIIAARENVSHWTEALYQGARYWEDIVQINWGNGIGDITYLNYKKELVILELKRTDDILVAETGIGIACKAKKSESKLTEDILKTTFYAAGKDYWDAVKGLDHGTDNDVEEEKMLVFDTPLKSSLFDTLFVDPELKGEPKAIHSEFIFITSYRKSKIEVTEEMKNKQTSRPIENVPYFGFHIQRVNMNKFVETGISYAKQGKLTWKTRKGDMIEPFQANDSGEGFARVIREFKGPAKKQVQGKREMKTYTLRVRIMTLYHFFNILADRIDEW
ncbi:MAG: AbrB/MazE/SpoVT family DNA-binding domain-containing protein, partial [Candidatus Odinarchaeota archaeon]